MSALCSSASDTASTPGSRRSAAVSSDSIPNVCPSRGVSVRSASKCEFFDRSTAVMAVLDKQNWLLRRSLGQRVHNQLKTVPEIQFFLDDSLEYIDNIDQLLREEK